MLAAMAKPEEAAPVRKAARSVRRQQLIDATIAILARKGYAALTVADVAKKAGLSAGIVIFHFNSKDELLAAALSFLAAEYRANWESRMAGAGPSPAERLEAMLLADFDEGVFTADKLAAWIAFWGETQGRPVYDQICAAHDAERRAVLENLCRELAADAGQRQDPAMIMRALDSLTDGLWLGLAATGAGHGGRVSASEARGIIGAALAAFFPRHFAAG